VERKKKKKKEKKKKEPPPIFYMQSDPLHPSVKKVPKAAEVREYPYPHSTSLGSGDSCRLPVVCTCCDVALARY
jgi:hypothetical protein